MDLEYYDDDNYLKKYELSTVPKHPDVYQEPYQILLRNFISKNTLNESMLVYAELGTGKCHAINTEIIMSDGSVKKVQDINVDDHLMGDDSMPRKVLSLARGKDIMFKVTLSNGDNFTVNQEHILCLKAPEFPLIQECLDEDDNIIITVTWIEQNSIKTKTFNGTSANKHIIQYLIDDLKTSIGLYHDQILEISILDFIKLSPFYKRLLKCYKVCMTLSKKQLRTTILDYVNSLSNADTSILTEIKYNDLDTRKEFIKHLFKDCLTLDISNLSSSLLDDIIYIARSIGMQPFYKDGQMFLKEQLMFDFILEELDTQDYYGFTLDGNSRYILADFTVTHNTCTAISIAEGFKEYIHSMNRKILVLVKNKNIAKNFTNELASKCTGDEYLTDEERYQYFSTNQSEETQTLVNKTIRKINKTYNIMTYGSFVNKVLGAKQFKKDEFGLNTSELLVEDGNALRKISGEKAMKTLNNTVIIVDEAHNVTNNDIYTALMKIINNSYNTRLVLLTATPIKDNAKEIMEINNLLNARSANVLPIRNEIFKTSPDTSLLQKTQSEIINTSVLKGNIFDPTDYGIKVLRKTLSGKVSYLGTNYDNFPQVIEKGTDLIPQRKGTLRVINCEMSEYQYNIYKKAFSDDVGVPITDRLIDDIEINEVVKTSALYKNSSDASTIVYPDNLYGKDGYEKLNTSILKGDALAKFSSKLYNLLSNLKQIEQGDDRGKAFIYSNYVSYGGISIVKDLLFANGYREYPRGGSMSFIVFDETTSNDRRDRLRRIFNDPSNKDGDNIRVIIGSPVISEGITLKCVRQVHILEPSWNMSRINQVVGRAVRKNSHVDLEENKRNVNVYKYISTYSNRPDDFYIDKEKYILSEEKDRANKKIERLLKEVSWDCPIHHSKNVLNSRFDFSSKCDYTNCDFKCDAPDVPVEKQYLTHTLNMDFFSSFSTDFIKDNIKKLFKTYYIWRLEDIVSRILSINNDVSTEYIYKILDDFIKDKIEVEDMHSRTGYLVNMGDYYIFNPDTLEPQSNIYNKMFNFSNDKKKYTIQDFLNTSISNPSPLAEASPSQGLSQDILQDISQDIIEYNDDLLNKYQILGTFRDRGNKNMPYGNIDGKFRIIDKRNSKSTKNDNRRFVSGMEITSYHKPQLIELIEFLGIPQQRLEFTSMTKQQLANLIKTTLVSNKLVLR